MATTLRCTMNLLKALKATPSEDASAGTSRLGDWTANLARVSRAQLVIAVSAPTRLAIVIDAAPYAKIPERLADRLFEMLCWIGIPELPARHEADMLRRPQLSRSNSRSVLGALNDYAFCAEQMLLSGRASDTLDVTRVFAKWLVLKPEPMHPADRVRELFGLNPDLPPQVPRW